MQKTMLSLLCISLFMACNTPPKVLNQQEKETIKNNLNTLMVAWHQAASDANAEVFFGTMDSISIYIGTDATENWSKEAFVGFAKPYFDRGKAWDFKTLERNIYTNDTGDIAWFDELLQTWMGTCRGSGVLQKKEEGWKIKHYVLSVEVPNDNIQEVIAANKKNDSIFMTNFKNKMK
ncbi:MAG: nuclear transport factor 2 family protein [Flavobacteriaceae bacterium]|nr:nuclear transport factor 2 family protein [Flavobacteriaceae bacterium]